MASTRAAVSLIGGRGTIPGPRSIFFRLPRRQNSAAGFRSTPVRAVLEDIVVTKNGEDATADSSPLGSSPQNAAPALPTPADADRQRFRLHWSVDMWRDFNPRSWLETINDENSPVSARLQAFANTLTSAVSTSGALSSTQSAQYWAYHVARSGFFAAQAIAGLALARAAAGSSMSATGPLSRFEQVARNGWQGPLAEAFMSYYQDYENIKAGCYALPWDMTTPSHRQFNPLFIARRAALFFSEAQATLRRRERGTPDELWIRSAFLPDYTQESFHYQSDGWMSTRSAQVYESSTETLFVGRQDAMQRSTLVPVAEFMAGRDASQVKALEVACGTGRFATFVKDNYPAMDLTLLDVSPFYLQEARTSLKHWKSKRAPELRLSGADGTGASFLQAAAESIPAADASYDLIYCVYCFHELPSEVRKAVAKEMARLVKPGGMVVLTDSAQLGDRPCFDKTLGDFENFNEPYYRDYVSTDLGALFEDAGLVPDLKVVSSTTKSLSFKKPAATEVMAPVQEEGVETSASQDAVKFSSAQDLQN